MAINPALATICAAVTLCMAGFAIDTDWDPSLIPPARAQSSQPKATAVTAGGITLHSVSVELPSSDRMFPGGADAEAINDNCLACHSAGMVLTQPAMDRTTWQREVEKMRKDYKAPVGEEDVPAIVAYLAAHKGTQ